MIRAQVAPLDTVHCMECSTQDEYGTTRRPWLVGLLLSVLVPFGVLAVPTTSQASSGPWTLASAPAPGGGWSTVNYVHDHWIALSHTGVMAVSSNGTTWTSKPVPVGSWQAVAYGAGRYVALSSSTKGPYEMTSTDGLAWSVVTGPPAPPRLVNQSVQYGQWSSVIYANGIFAAVSAVGAVVTSTNGLSWKQQLFYPQDHYTSITFGNGRFVATDATQGDLLMSLGQGRWGITHLALVGPVTIPSGGLHLSAVAYGHGNFVAFGSGAGAGYVATSVYGNTWALHHYAPSQSIVSAVYGCDAFVAAGQSNTDPFISSASGINFTPVTVATPTVSSWTSVNYGAGRYVAVDSAGDIASSRADTACSQAPTSPQQVSGNLHNAEAWTYMHPPAKSGTAPVLGYRVTITDGATTRVCGAPVYSEPNCIIKGLMNHRVYWVTAQAYNRFGLSAPSDPEFVVPVPVWSLSATAPAVSATGAPLLVTVTGIIANSLGFYPVTPVSVYLGSQRMICSPSPFGECLVTFDRPTPGVEHLYATYTGYGRFYRSPTQVVRVR